MKKNTVALAVAAAMTASLLVGCGGTAADSTSTAESTATSTDAASAATTTAGGDETLTVWAWDPNFNIYALKQAEAIYQKDHPNFKLDIQENTYNDIETKLITAATSGDYSTLPDVFLMQDYSFHKYIANFPDVFTDITDSGIDFTQFTEGKLADSTADGNKKQSRKRLRADGSWGQLIRPRTNCCSMKSGDVSPLTSVIGLSVY